MAHKQRERAREMGCRAVYIPRGLEEEEGGTRGRESRRRERRIRRRRRESEEARRHEAELERAETIRSRGPQKKRH